MPQIRNLTSGSDAMKIDTTAKQMIANGARVYNLAAGDPDVTSLPIALRYIDLSKCHNYTSSFGIKSLRDSIGKNVVLCNGCKQLIYMSLLATCKPEDHVVIVGPCWSSYIEICKLVGCEYTLSIGKKENQYVPSNIKSHIKKNTKAILFNNPNNPTGKVYSKEFIDNLKDLSLKKDLWIISDEIYSNFVYSGNFISLSDFDNAIVINGMSKSHGLTGLRFGWASSLNDEIINQIGLIQGQLSGPPSTLTQHIVEFYKNYLFKYPLDSFEFKDRRDILANGNQLLMNNLPDGGLYFYVPVKGNSSELCERLLQEYHIAVTPGDMYGVKNTIRISFACISKEQAREINPILNKELN